MELGYYLDVTRGKVPTLATLKGFVDTLKKFGYTQLQLYVEHTFAFRGFEEMWEDVSPLLPEEIKELDSYCRDNGIELVPSFSTFGHLYHLLNTEKYKHLNEIDLDRPFNWPDRMSHSTIDVSNPQSIEVIKDMISQALEVFSSDKFNICCDETFDLGEGKNKEKAQQVGKGRLYVDFLNQIIEFVESQGKTVMFWGDIILNHPEYMSELSKKAIVLNWGYDRNVKEEQAEAFAKTGLKQYVCPSVNGYNQWISNIEEAFLNIKIWMQYARKYNAEGMLLTDWGDFGHINSLTMSMPGLVYASLLMKDFERYSTDMEAAYREVSGIVFGDETIIQKLVDIRKKDLFSWGNWNFIDVYYNLNYKHQWFQTEYLDEIKYKDDEDERSFDAIYEAYIAQINAARDYIQENLDDEAMKEDLVVALDGQKLQHKYFLFLKGKKCPSFCKELVADIDEFFEAFSKNWNKTNKPSELFRIGEFFDRQKENLIRFC